MTDLSAVLQLRERICQRLQTWPGDAEAEQQLLAWFGRRGAVERCVAERVCTLAVMLAMDTGPARRLQAHSQGGTLMALALDAVAHTFAEEIAQLRVVMRRVVRQAPPEADLHALQAGMVITFITGKPVSDDSHSHPRAARPPEEEHS